MSGLARGIDRAAHEGCLVAGGKTVAVLGTPLDRVYPREHAPSQELIGEVGAAVSQFCPGFPVRRHFFPARNANMSGLSLGTVVVEASETSGVLIQARKALEQGRKLFIPQSAVDDPLISWPRRFLEKGAVALRTINEVIAALKERGPAGGALSGGSASARGQLRRAACSLRSTRRSTWWPSRRPDPHGTWTRGTPSPGRTGSRWSSGPTCAIGNHGRGLGRAPC